MPLKKFSFVFDKVKNWFSDRLRADSTLLGKILKVLGYISTTFGVVVSFYGPLYVAERDVSGFVIGFGIACILSGFMSQSKTLSKTVIYKDKTLKYKFDIFLKKLADKFGADKTFICKYHNGTSFNTLPTGRFTMIRYHSKKRYPVDEQSMYNQPMQSLAEAYTYMKKQGFACLTVNNSPMDLRHQFESEGVNACVYVPIYKPVSKEFSGFLGLVFYQDDFDLDHDTLEELSNDALDLRGAFSSVKVKKLV